MKRVLDKLTANKFLIVFIIFLGLLARLYKINNPIADWHSWRQADTASVSRIYVDEGINPLVPRYYDISSIQTGYFNPEGYRFVEFPLFNVIHAGLVTIFDTFSLEVWGRLVSIFSALISTYVIFLLAKKHMDETSAIFSALFFALIPFNVYFTRVILPEPLAIMLGLLAILIFSNYLDNKKSSLLILSGLTFAFSILVKPFTIFYGIVILYLAVNKYGVKGIVKNSKIFIRMLLFLFVVIAPFLLWRVWTNKYFVGVPFTKWMFNGDGIRFRPAFFRWIFYERLTKLILGVWGIIPFLIGLIFYKGRNYFMRSFLLAVLVYVVIFATVNVRHDYYQSIIVPGVALAFGAGMSKILNVRKVNNLFKQIIILLLFVLMLYNNFSRVKDFYQINHPEILRAGTVVDELTPNDARIIAPYNGDTAFLYQTKRYGWPAVDTSFDKLIDKRGADYYVSVTKDDEDTKFLLDKYKVVKETRDFVIINLHEEKK